MDTIHPSSHLLSHYKELRHGEETAARETKSQMETGPCVMEVQYISVWADTSEGLQSKRELDVRNYGENVGSFLNGKPIICQLKKN